MGRAQGRRVCNYYHMMACIGEARGELWILANYQVRSSRHLTRQYWNIAQVRSKRRRRHENDGSTIRDLYSGLFYRRRQSLIDLIHLEGKAGLEARHHGPPANSGLTMIHEPATTPAQPPLPQESFPRQALIGSDFTITVTSEGAELLWPSGLRLRLRDA